MKGSAVAARHAVARERAVIVSFQPSLLAGGEAASSNAIFVNLDRRHRGIRSDRERAS